MKCPIDQGELQKRIYEADIEIDECTTCLGIWLDKGELEQIEQSKMNDYRQYLESQSNTNPFSNPTMSHGQPVEPLPPTPDRKLTCPKCGDVMHQREHGLFSGILIDCCVGCQGIWLDKGELQDIEIFYEKHQSQESQMPHQGFFDAFISGLLFMFD